MGKNTTLFSTTLFEHFSTQDHPTVYWVLPCILSRFCHRHCPVIQYSGVVKLHKKSHATCITLHLQNVTVTKTSLRWLLASLEEILSVGLCISTLTLWNFCEKDYSFKKVHNSKSVWKRYYRHSNEVWLTVFECCPLVALTVVIQNSDVVKLKNKDTNTNTKFTLPRFLKKVIYTVTQTRLWTMLFSNRGRIDGFRVRV